MLEERTQAIGRELLAAARREHAQLSVLNRWTAHVLSWCLSDPQVKSSVLRFIDVLPSLSDPAEIARHLRDYFPPEAKLPAALRLGTQLAHPGLLTQHALSSVIRQLVEQVARQFIAEHRPEAAANVIHALAAQGATCSLDMLGEQVLSEEEADRYAAQCLTLLRESLAAYASLPPSTTLMSCGPRVNLSVKPSALASRFDPISPTSSITQASQRVFPLLQLAAQQGALINLDMEQSELRDLTLALAKRLLVHPETEPRAELGIVIQAYLRDAEQVVDELLSWLATHERTLTVRLVKGAYWDSEVAQARSRYWPVPVHQTKAETDSAFERLTERLLAASPLVTTAIASHNLRSIAHAMAVAESLGLANDRLEFQLLYGMGEAIHAAILSRGYPVRIYTPIGELIPGMAYLVRRLLENTANESFLRQDLSHEQDGEALLERPTVGDGAIDSADSMNTAEAFPWRVEPASDFSRDAARARFADALRTVRHSLGRTYPMLIGDRETETTRSLISSNPTAPSVVIGRVSNASVADVDQAVAAAAAAYPAWARTPVRERAACLRRAAELIRDRHAELAAWEVFEVGKTWREADADIVEAIDYLEYYSWGMEALAKGKPALQAPGESNRYRYEPRGVAVVIAPWNFPAAILIGMAGAALVAGNAVIIKPSEQSSVIAVQLAQLLRSSGIPPAILQCLPGSGEEIGAALVRHPGTHVTLFTGSKAVGLSIIEAAARVAPGQRFVKHVVAEMGGKNALIVDADADLDAAIIGILRSAFGYSGQKCSAASRLIVHERVCDRLLPRLAAAVDRLVMDDPADVGTDLGPLIEASAQQRLLQAIDRAKRVGRVVYEYPSSRLPREGYFVGPVIAADVPPGDLLAKEELFGPLLSVFRARTFEEAIALANDTDYALTGGVYSRSPSNLQHAVDAFDAGVLYLNRPMTGALVGRQPFGGHRLSGLGTKAGGPDYLLQLVIPQTICTDTTRHGMPLA